jgi:hypothetical protein
MCLRIYTQLNWNKALNFFNGLIDEKTSNSKGLKENSMNENFKISGFQNSENRNFTYLSSFHWIGLNFKLGFLCLLNLSNVSINKKSFEKVS